MARDFVLDPDTNTVKVVVTTHQDIERDVLEQAVSDAEDAKAELLNAKLVAFQEALDEDPEVVAAEQAVADCKSELSGYDSVAPTTDGMDAGTEGSGGEDQDSGQLVETPDPTVI